MAQMISFLLPPQLDSVFANPIPLLGSVIALSPLHSLSISDVSFFLLANYQCDRL